MSRKIVATGVAAACLLLALLGYFVMVPAVMSAGNYLWVSAIVLALVGVGLAMWLEAEPQPTIEQVLYDTEHPMTRQE